MAAARNTDWPQWWDWELELTSHLLKRMVDRGFSEVDLRSMMASAMSFRKDLQLGRWVVETMHASSAWEVVVEPDAADKLLVVITAYPVESA